MSTAGELQNKRRASVLAFQKESHHLFLKTTVTRCDARSPIQEKTGKRNDAAGSTMAANILVSIPVKADSTSCNSEESQDWLETPQDTGSPATAHAFPVVTHSIRFPQPGAPKGHHRHLSLPDQLLSQHLQQGQHSRRELSLEDLLEMKRRDFELSQRQKKGETASAPASPVRQHRPASLQRKWWRLFITSSLHPQEGLPAKRDPRKINPRNKLHNGDDEDNGSTITSKFSRAREERNSGRTPHVPSMTSMASLVNVKADAGKGPRLRRSLSGSFPFFSGTTKQNPKGRLFRWMSSRE